MSDRSPPEDRRLVSAVATVGAAFDLALVVGGVVIAFVSSAAAGAAVAGLGLIGLGVVAVLSRPRRPKR